MNRDEFVHRIYALTVEGEIFYIGYSHARPLRERLQEHIYAAIHPNKKEQTNRLVRGHKSAKDQIIVEALRENWSLQIVLLYEIDSTVPIDEQEWINDYRERGHLLTNQAIGNIHQPHCLIKNQKYSTKEFLKYASKTDENRV